MSAAIIALGGLAASCSSDEGDDDAIPYQPFADIVVNLNLPSYVALRTNGGWLNIGDGGVRGIILYRVNASTYYAFERNCSYHPNEACSTVEVHATTLYMHDPCCGSVFNFEGEPTGGPAWRPLRKYQTYLNGPDLVITDEIIQ